MAFTLPTFNLLCDIGLSTAAGWPGSNAGWAARLVNVPCALVYGRRVGFNASDSIIGGSPGHLGMHVLLPALTDVRGLQSFTGQGNKVDWIQCPSGSGRWYAVTWVDDIGKGWPNEHRTAECLAVGSTWVAPYP